MMATCEPDSLEMPTRSPSLNLATRSRNSALRVLSPLVSFSFSANGETERSGTVDTTTLPPASATRETWPASASPAA